MDKDQKLITFLDSLGPDADVDFAQQLLEAHSWDLQAALETVTGRGQTAVSAEVPLRTDEARPPMRTGYVDRLIHSHEEDDEAIAMAQSAAAAADEASARLDLERVLLESQQAFEQQAEIQEQAALAQALEASYAAVSPKHSNTSAPSRSPGTPTAYPERRAGQRDLRPDVDQSRLSGGSRPGAARFRLQPRSSSSVSSAPTADAPPARPVRPAVSQALKPPPVVPTTSQRAPKEVPTKERHETKASSSAKLQPSAKPRPAQSMQQPASRQQHTNQKMKAEAVTNDRRPNLASRCLSRFCSSSKDSTKAPSTESPPGKPVKEAHSTPSKKDEVARKDMKPAKQPGPKPAPAASQGSVATPKAESEAAMPSKEATAADRFAAHEESELRREREEAELKRKEAEGGGVREPDPVVNALQALRRQHLKRDPAALATCLQTLHAYISNLAKNPQESKFHSINCQNSNFRSRVAALEGGIEVLQACGFVAVDEKLCVDPDFMKSKGPKLWDALSKVAVLLEQVKSCM
ncbi:UBXN6 [Symbiodinium sp. CCMP2592]|nr:UBXN6 [Symbiodinium sp. CCMP2592]